MVRSYSELQLFPDFQQRYEYLKLSGAVGDPTFGSERYLNQKFYRSVQWRRIRDHVIARDEGMDLGAQGYEIYDTIYIHHMNPVRSEDLHDFNEDILNPEFLITTTHRTHNAIHYGDASLLRQPFIERSANDTTPWRR